jgi:hypothetical protein
LNNAPLTPEEKDRLVKAVGGPDAARSLIASICRFTEVFVGGPTFCAKDKMFRMLTDKRYIEVDDVVTELLCSPTYVVSLARIHLKLMMVTPAALGLPGGGTYTNIVTAARKRKLEYCPDDTAAAMMLQMSKPWSKNGPFVVATAPITHEERPYLFQVVERRLTVTPGDPGRNWGPDDQFLFREV